MMPLLAALLANPLSYVIAAVVVASPWLIKRIVGKAIDARFDREADAYRQRLDVMTEAARFTMQRDLADFSLYAAKKHEAAGEVWRALRKAHGAVSGLFGLQTLSTMEEYNEHDLRAAFDDLAMPQGKQDEILAQWHLNPTAALKDAQPYLRMLRIQSAERVLRDAQNTIYLNELYFPDEIIGAIDPLVRELNDWMMHMSHPETFRGDGWLPDQKRLSGILERTHTALRQLVAGTSNHSLRRVGGPDGKLTTLGD